MENIELLPVATLDEMATILRCKKEHLQVSWRSWPHFFVGRGKTADYARFVPTDVITFLKKKGVGYVDLDVSDKERAKVESMAVSRRRKNKKQGGILKPGISGKLGSGAAENSVGKEKRIADKFGIC